MKAVKLLIVILSFSFASHSSFAALILSSDFTEELSLPYLVGPDVRVLQSLGKVLGAGDELTDANQISNPGRYSGHANMDLSASGLLTLTGKHFNGVADYQLAVFSLNNVLFAANEIIVGVSIIGLGNELFDGAFGPSFPLPVIFFTDNSVNISYNVGSLQNTREEFNFGDDLQAQFQLITAQVSAPGTLGLFMLVLMFIGFKRPLRNYY